MLSLIAAVVCSTLISVFFKLCEGKSTNRMGLFVANYSVCLLLSLFFQGGIPSHEEGSAFAVGLGLVSGFLYLFSFVLLNKSIRQNGVILSSTFMKLGILLPTVMAIVIFGEKPTIFQISGIILAIAAIIIMNYSNEKSIGKAFMLLPFLMIVSGITDSTTNIFDELGAASCKDIFLCVTFFSALCFSVFSNVREKGRISGKDLLWGILVGVPNYFSSRFLLGALAAIPAIIVYPVFSVGTILLITLVGTFFFGEKLHSKEIVSMAVILCALVLLNV